MSASAPDNMSPLTLLPTSEESVDAGALELGVESAWNLDDISVSGLERSDSVRAEPPSGEPTDQTGSHLAGAVIDSRTPSVRAASSTPFLDNGGNKLKDSPDDGDGLGSVAMSISPPMVQSSEKEPLPARDTQMGLSDSLRYQYRRHDELDSDRLNEMPSWADLPINDDIGDVPDLKVSTQGNHAPYRAREAKLAPKAVKIEGGQTNNLQYQRASSLLPAESSVKRAMTGVSKQGHDPGEPDPPSSDNESERLSTESDNDKPARKSSKKIPTLMDPP
ncbi:uncharacterized protein F5147DRAFT_771719 [Suillus discolor]|uniref:Uncharacterized protein n=1 Tax=Suillus discolor TaxID=1912936 RepID=A0A9P7FBI6_9AGAM|nr:uncharacterized protein F5147DRAFT_771719 [Suillus discolor]KAG2111576.1 hypothetical protein F5147DRAFT_771719 [Suillus discolor]